jgi:hypothetical protein
MVVEESRLLQVSIFTILHKNTHHLDYIKLLPDVVTIADEVDTQLKQQMLHYIQANAIGTTPHSTQVGPVLHDNDLPLESSVNSHDSHFGTLRRTIFLPSCEGCMPRPPRETPIERIFREIMRQKMPLAIRHVLLRKPVVPSLKSQPNGRA